MKKMKNKFLSYLSSISCSFIMSLCLCSFVFNFFSTCYADPWGKDADLALSKKCCQEPSSTTSISTPILGPIAESLIWVHQNVITQIDGPRSNFIPSSSQYTLEAMRKYGF